tara:strand:- start:3972 stop:4202 length:231 start_codon:yes stop_codon:yes gene_type:complete
MSGAVAYTIDEIDNKISELTKELKKWELKKKQAENVLKLVKIRRMDIASKAGLKKKRSKKRKSKRRKSKRRKTRRK